MESIVEKSQRVVSDDDDDPEDDDDEEEEDEDEEEEEDEEEDDEEEEEATELDDISMSPSESEGVSDDWKAEGTGRLRCLRLQVFECDFRAAGPLYFL